MHKRTAIHNPPQRPDKVWQILSHDRLPKELAIRLSSVESRPHKQLNWGVFFEQFPVPNLRLEIHETPSFGVGQVGLFAGQAIPKGTCLGPYRGVLVCAEDYNHPSSFGREVSDAVLPHLNDRALSKEETQARCDLFVGILRGIIPPSNDYLIGAGKDADGKQLGISPTPQENSPLCLINHNATPNCENRVCPAIKDGKKLFVSIFYAVRDIRCGEELTWSYLGPDAKKYPYTLQTLVAEAFFNLKKIYTAHRVIQDLTNSPPHASHVALLQAIQIVLDSHRIDNPSTSKRG